MVREKRLIVRLSPGEHLCLAAAARASALAPSSWVRHQALRAAGSAPKPAPLPAPPLRSPAATHAHVASTCFTAAQIESLRDYAQACGLTVSQFMRQVLLGVVPVVRRSPVRAAIVAVNRAAINLDQLLRLADRGSVAAPDLQRAAAEILVEVRALRAALLKADAAASPEPAA
jgi:hypothetical protein